VGCVAKGVGNQAACIDTVLARLVRRAHPCPKIGQMSDGWRGKFEHMHVARDVLSRES
jgi:hypothetical protein